jgi:hypothetical protein
MACKQYVEQLGDMGQRSPSPPDNNFLNRCIGPEVRLDELETDASWFFLKASLEEHPEPVRKTNPSMKHPRISANLNLSPFAFPSMGEAALGE